MDEFVFYSCKVCGAMSLENFRDHWCRVCKVSMKVSRHTLRQKIDTSGIAIQTEDAPHTEEEGELNRLPSTP